MYVLLKMVISNVMLVFKGVQGMKYNYQVIQGGAQNRLFPLGEIARLMGVSYNPSYPFISGHL